MNGECSRSVQVISGAPQGFVLGPLLFLIYIDTINLLQLSEGTKISLYADDILIYKPISTDSCYEELQEDINSIFQWSVDNLMSFNIAKCKCMLLTHKRNACCPSSIRKCQPIQVFGCDHFIKPFAGHLKFRKFVRSQEDC